MRFLEIKILIKGFREINKKFIKKITVNSGKENIVERTADFIKNNRLLEKGDKLLLSLSAGKDSMAMLDILVKIRERLGVRLAVFHLNHIMRGEDSDKDEELVRKTAEEYDIKFHIERYNFKDNKYAGASFEEFARVKRYELLRITAGESGFNKIATAHNSDDNVETVIMRIFKGTGIHGLGGIKIKNGDIIRPILFLSSDEIYGYLKENSIKWREDLSNQDNSYLRNYVRNIIIPAVKTRFDNADTALNTLSSISREYSSMLEDMLREKYNDLYQTEEGKVIIEIEKFINDKRVFKFIVSKSLRDEFGSFVNQGMLDDIYKKAVIEKSHVDIYRGHEFFIRKSIMNYKPALIISKGNYYSSLEEDKWEYMIEAKDLIDGSINIDEIGRIIHTSIVDYEFFKDNIGNNKYIFIAIDEKLEYITIRNRRKGDKIRLKSGLKKIKDIFIDLKLDKKTKEAIPIIIINSETAAYLPGLIINENNRVSEDFYVDNNSKKILAIHYI